MERACRHCPRARISICHQQIANTKKDIRETLVQLADMLDQHTFSSSNFLKSRAHSVQCTINARHEKKLDNLRKEQGKSNDVDKDKWVINLSSKPLSAAERSLLEKGPKFATTPHRIPYKSIVAEIEAAITNFPDEEKSTVRTTATSLLLRAQLPNHNNITVDERKALFNLKKDPSRVVTKADKGNCFVVLDKTNYEEKMKNPLSDRNIRTRKLTNPHSKDSNGNSTNDSFASKNKRNLTNPHTNGFIPRTAYHLQ